MDISINNHNFLGKLTIIKNCLSMAMETEQTKQTNLNYLKTAFDANQQLIDQIKSITKNGQDTNR